MIMTRRDKQIERHLHTASEMALATRLMRKLYHQHARGTLTFSCEPASEIPKRDKIENKQVALCGSHVGKLHDYLAHTLSALAGLAKWSLSF